MQSTPHVLAIGDDMLRTEMRVYAEHTGATIQLVADADAAAEFWTTAPLIVVTEDAAVALAASDLPSAERYGDVVMLVARADVATWELAVAIDANYTCVQPAGTAWLLNQMRKATVAA